MAKVKICKVCGKEFTGGNSFHKLCDIHNKERLRSLKSSKVEANTTPDYHITIHKTRPKETKIHKPEVKGKHEIVNPYNVTGEKELFAIIWQERPHVCSNPKCKKPLGDEMVAHYFSHIYPKSIRPWLRLDPDNIELLCIECHHEHDFGKRTNKL